MGHLRAEVAPLAQPAPARTCWRLPSGAAGRSGSSPGTSLLPLTRNAARTFFVFSLCCSAVRWCGGPRWHRTRPAPFTQDQPWRQLRTRHRTSPRTPHAPSLSTRRQRTRRCKRRMCSGSCRRLCELLQPSWPHCCSSQSFRPTRLQEHAECRGTGLGHSCARADTSTTTTTTTEDEVGGASCAGARSAADTSLAPG